MKTSSSSLSGLRAALLSWSEMNYGLCKLKILSIHLWHLLSAVVSAEFIVNRFTLMAPVETFLVSCCTGVASVVLFGVVDITVVGSDDDSGVD